MDPILIFWAVVALVCAALGIDPGVYGDEDF
jgi:hypothetical protein